MKPIKKTSIHLQIKINVLIALAVVACVLFSCFSASAGGTYLKDTTIKAQTFQMFRGAKGGKFIVITSKSGNQYKKYFK